MVDYSKYLSSKNEVWATPQRLFDELDAEFNFTLDPCCTHENAKCEKHYTKEDDGLIQDLGGQSVFCNPPYGRVLKDWVHKCYSESRKPNTTVVMLVPSRTDTDWFHRYCLPHAEIRFVRGRLRFGNSTQNAPFASMIIIFNSK